LKDIPEAKFMSGEMADMSVASVDQARRVDLLSAILMVNILHAMKYSIIRMDFQLQTGLA